MRVVSLLAATGLHTPGQILVMALQHHRVGRGGHTTKPASQLIACDKDPMAFYKVSMGESDKQHVFIYIFALNM